MWLTVPNHEGRVAWWVGSDGEPLAAVSGQEMCTAVWLTDPNRWRWLSVKLSTKGRVHGYNILPHCVWEGRVAWWVGSDGE